MSTRHLVDPELLPLIDGFPPGPITAENLGELRAAGAARQAALPPPPVAPEPRSIPGPPGAPEVPVLVYRPKGQTLPVAALLHFHGGGMISGAPDLTALGSAAVALEIGFVVVSVGYRLAPETPFPGPHEDGYAALTWLFGEALALGIDPASIAVSGDSAGGGLAAALALIARDRGEFPIAAQFLTYPMLDHRTGGRDDPYANPATGEFAWTRASNRFGWAALQGDYAIDDGRIGWFSPARATSLAGLPPAWIGVGTLDLFRGECEAYARRLDHAGVATQLHLYPGAPHAFNAVAEAGVTRAWRADLTAALTTFAGIVRR